VKVGRRFADRKVFTVVPADTLETAFQLMVSHRIRHLPVVEGDEVVGMLSDRDLKSALVRTRGQQSSRGAFLIPPGITVGDLMSHEPMLISPMTDVEEAARLMYRHKIGALPVVEGGRLVGIVTETDILGIFIEIMGVIESSSRIDVEMDDDPALLDRAAEIIRKSRGKIISVAMSPPSPDHSRTYYFRLSSCDTSPIVRSLEGAGFHVLSAMN
jgi:acetoin utilization protein AcuB